MEFQLATNLLNNFTWPVSVYSSVKCRQYSLACPPHAGAGADKVTQGVCTKTVVMHFDRAGHGRCSLSSLGPSLLACNIMRVVAHQHFPKGIQWNTRCRCSRKAFGRRVAWSNVLGKYVIPSFWRLMVMFVH